MTAPYLASGSSLPFLFDKILRPNAGLRVLLIDDFFPHASIGAGAPRALAMLDALISAGAAVTHLSTGADHRYIPKVAPQCVVFGLGDLQGLRESPFDVVIISRPHNMKLVRQTFGDAWITAGFVVYDSEALYTDRRNLRAEVLGQSDRFDARDEMNLARGTRTVLTVNEYTRRQFADAGHPDVRIVRHAVDARGGKARFESRNGLLFVGPIYSDETPNGDAVVWFLDKVYPEIVRRLDMPLTLVGYQNSPYLRSFTAIRSLGPIENLSPVYDAARVFIAPTRFAAGIPLKVYDAAAAGVPCVITPLLARQLEWTDGVEALVAERPAEFGAACLRLHTDKSLWADIRRNALARTKRDCSRSAFRSVIKSLLSDVRKTMH